LLAVICNYIKMHGHMNVKCNSYSTQLRTSTINFKIAQIYTFYLYQLFFYRYVLEYFSSLNLTLHFFCSTCCT